MNEKVTDGVEVGGFSVVRFCWRKKTKERGNFVRARVAVCG